MAEVPRGDVEAPPRRERPGGGSSNGVEGDFNSWAWFTGGLMGLVGIFQLMTGIVALAGTGYYTVPSRNLVVDASYSTWGWVHLILGIVLLATGGGIALGNAVARVAGIVVAVLSAVVNLAFLPAAPVAAILIIFMDVFVIYAITIHGGQPERAR